MATLMRSLLVALILTCAISAIPAQAAEHDADTHVVAADDSHAASTDEHAQAAQATDGEHAEEMHGEGHSAHAQPAAWSVIPFVALLLCIAICPLAAPHFWHHHYPKVAVVLGLITGAYYIFALHDHISLVHVGFEYFSFIALLTGLFVAAGGIVINIDKKATPALNAGILGFGAVIANVIGTTGAAMLLIRTFMRINKGRLKAYHIIFFIFIVANVGGALTPIGDPPLFLGFLKGIAFFQFFELDVLPWLVGVGTLLIMFFVIDSMNKTPVPELDGGTGGGQGISVKGGASFVWLFLVVGAVFLDPNKLGFLPCITITDHAHIGFGFGSQIDPTGAGGHVVEGFSFVREIIQLSVGIAAFKLANSENLEANGFSFDPIKEVGYLFIGIFLTMVPALALIKAWAGDPSNAEFLTPSTLYFGTGMLSGVLDNAPTFLSFLAGLEGEVHMTAGQISHMVGWSGDLPHLSYQVEIAYLDHIRGEAYFTSESIGHAIEGLRQLATMSPELLHEQVAAHLQQTGVELSRATELAANVQVAEIDALVAHLQSLPDGMAAVHAKDIDLLDLSDELAACAVAAVFWGAFTYIGNGPNFMVKSIADSSVDENGDKVVECPSFFGYVLKFSIPFLLPMLLLVWLLFFSPWQVL